VAVLHRGERGSAWKASSMSVTGRVRRPASLCSAFAGCPVPPDVIVLAVRCYLRFGLSYRDVEELLAEGGVDVDHKTIYRWVHRFTPLLAEAARPPPRRVGDRWYVDETIVADGVLCGAGLIDPRAGSTLHCATVRSAPASPTCTLGGLDDDAGDAHADAAAADLAA
jgi:hypothetical protein